MATVTSDTAHNLVHRFSIGQLRFASLSDGFLPSTTKMTAPEIAEDELAAFMIERGQHPTEKITPISCLLVELPELGPVIVDTGHGALPGPNGKPIPTAGRLPEALRAAGVDPAAVEHVLISHLHPDHIGGLFNDDDRMFFANATYHVPQEEVDFWGQDKPDLDGSLLPPPMRVAVIGSAQRFIALAGERLKTFQAGDEPLPGVRTILLAGHTPGQVGFLFESEGEAILHSADAAPHHLISLERPDWRFSFDTDAPRAVATRKALVAQLADNGWYNFTPHFPWPSFGRVVREGTRMVWHPGK